MAAVLAGDVNQYGHLVRRYQDTYRRFAARVLGSADDADDALQLAFVRAFRALSQCKDPSRFAGWLYRIVVNECRTFGARRARRARRMVRDEAALETAPADSMAESEGTELQEIHRALDRLDPDHREAFVLKHVEQLSYMEISELTGVGESALKMRVKRACDRLRELLEKVPNGG